MFILLTVQNLFKSFNIDIDFNPGNFIDNLSYMGTGMLGIFAVIAFIILMVYILNAFSKNKN